MVLELPDNSRGWFQDAKRGSTVVHGCWLFFSGGGGGVATGFYPFYHCRLSAHVCGIIFPYHFPSV